ncbi:hypothetical protein NP233_g6304 [Leucocoprinus birnbaumii]|uniref:C2H2-type domain-containing protein n=1 Tax=Leucocoprinus birnbaumii TaxID=56174 RepID=A0AAD5VR94_9AGAR|nr:hypothetical protein NP233_g6304 [Leucocoprinus birnbaumii]
MLYECLDCDRTFATGVGVQSHSRAKGHDIPECDECDRIFVNENALTNHNNAVHRYCANCNRSFGTYAAYRQVSLTSIVCPVVFPLSKLTPWDSIWPTPPAHQYQYSDNDTESYYESESESDEEDPAPTYCYSCNRSFVNNAALNSHLAFSSAHNWCFVCSRDFSSENALAQHNASPAHRGRTFQCPFCTSMFKTPSSIAMHIESGCHRINRHQVTAAIHKLNIVPQISISHRIEGPQGPPTRLITYSANERAFNGHAYECYLCHRTFKSLDRLNQHLNSSTHDDLEFRCPHCASEFQLISGLVQHIESESCGIARFNEVTRHFNSLTDGFKRLLTH